MGFTNKQNMTNNKCRRFQSNIFNKTRCQNCFKSKDEHSAEALEFSRTARKVCLCGYLFVAPDVFNFSNPIDRSKRWQRRFFVLYDSGELTYSVDENVGTIPQGEINLNVCSEVFDAEQATSHQFSLGLAAQGGVTYIKGSTKDEITRWKNALLTFTQTKPVKPRNLSLPAGIALKDLPSSITKNENNNEIKLDDWSDASRRPPSSRITRRSTHDSSQIMTGRIGDVSGLQHDDDDEEDVGDGRTTAGPLTYRGVRNLKRRGDKSFGDLVKKTSSLENLSAPYTGSSSSLSREPSRSQSGDRTGILVSELNNNYYNNRMSGTSDSSKTFYESDEPRVTTGGFRVTPLGASYSMYADLPSTRTVDKYEPAVERSRSVSRHRTAASIELDRVNSTSIVSNTTQMWEQRAKDSSPSRIYGNTSRGRNRAQSVVEVPRRRVSPSPARPVAGPAAVSPSLARPAALYPSPARPAAAYDAMRQLEEQHRLLQQEHQQLSFSRGDVKREICRFDVNENKFRPYSNETDELKMAKNVEKSLDHQNESDKQSTRHIKKGWLFKQANDKSWAKSWVILTESSLLFYADVKAEITDSAEDIVLLSSHSSILNVDYSRNYAFRISNGSDQCILSAITFSLRSSWMDAITNCIESLKKQNSIIIPEPTNNIPENRLKLLCVTATQKENSDITDDHPPYSNGQTKSTWPFSTPAPPPPPNEDFDIPSSDSSRHSVTLSSSYFSELGENCLGVVRPISQIQQKQQTIKPIPVLTQPANLSSLNLEDVPSRRRRRGPLADGEPDSSSTTTASSPALDEMLNQHSALTHRAPSTKIRERTRNKSPKRVRSPPPNMDPEISDDNDTMSELSREFEQIAMNNSLIDRLEAEIRYLKNKLSKSAKDSHSKEIEIDSLQQRISELEQTGLSDGESKLERQQMEKLLEDSQIKLDALERSIKNKTAEINQLESQLQISTKQTVQLSNEVEKITDKLKQKENVIVTLRSEIAETKRVSSELDTLRKQLRENDSKMESLQRTCLERVRNAENDRETVENQLRELELKIMEKEMKTANNDSDNAATVSKLQNELQVCNSKLLELQENLAAEKQAVVNSVKESHNKEMMSLQKELSDARKLVADLEADVKHLRDEGNETAAIISEKNTKNLLLQQDLENVEKKLSQLQQQNEALSKEVLALNNSLVQQKNEIEDKEKEISVFNSNALLSAKECENCDALKSQVKSLQGEIRDLKEEMKENSSKASQYDEANSSAELLKKRLESVQEELKCLQKDADEEIQGRDDIIAELHEKYEASQSECNTYMHQLSDALQANKEFEEELTSVKEQYEVDLEQKVFEVTSAERKIEDLEEQLAEISKRKDSSNAGFSAVANDTDQFKVVSELKQKIHRMEISHQEEIEQCNAKLQDAGKKLLASERRQERLERCSTGNSLEDVTDGDIVSNSLHKTKELEEENKKLILEKQKLTEELSSMDGLKFRLLEYSAENENLLAKNNQLLNELENLKSNQSKISNETDELTRDQNTDRFTDELKAELRRKETSYTQELQAVRDGFEIRIRSLQCDLSATRADLNKCQAEKDDNVAAYEKRLADLDSELRRYKTVRVASERSRDRERAREALRRAESVPNNESRTSAVDESEVNDLKSAVDELTLELQRVRENHKETLQRLRVDANPELLKHVDAELHIKELEDTIHNMKVDYEQELAMQKSAHRRELAQSREDVLHRLATAEANSIPIDEESIRRKYLKEVDRVKEIYDRGFSTMEKSHQRTMMEMRKNHKQELEKLRAEKDQLLVEETKATQAALDAMRKAHEAELEEERKKFLDLISKTFSHADMETLQRQHEEDLRLIQYEIRQVSEQYTVKCLENAALSDRLAAQTKALSESRARVQDLLVRNDELTTRLKYDIEKLNRLVMKRCSQTEFSDNSEDANELRMVLNLKEAEVTQLSEQIVSLKHQLNVKSEELQEVNEKYLELYNDHHSESRRSVDSYNTLDLSKLRLGFDSIRERSVGSDTDLLGSTDDLLHCSHSSSETSLLRIDEPSVDEGGVLGGGGMLADGGMDESDITDDPIEAILPRRSLWRMRNPQRAKSSPAGPDHSILNFSSSIGDRQQSSQQ